MTVIDDQWNISFSQSFKVKVTRMSSKVVFGGVPRKKKADRISRVSLTSNLTYYHLRVKSIAQF